MTTLGTDGRLGSLSGGGAASAAVPGEGPLPPVAAATRPASTVPAQALLSPAQSSVVVGEEFTVDVRIADAQDVFAATFNLGYDPNFVQFIDSSTGSFMTSDGAQGSVEVSQSGSNRLVIVGRRAPDAGGIDGAGRLVTLRFRSIALGESLVDLQGSALQGPAGEVLEAQFWGARVTGRQHP